MFDIFLWGLAFIVSLAVLLKASDFFTDSAEKIGLFFKLSPFVIGVTIVAFGTSLPELVSSLFAVFQGYSEIVAGNVIGSNITNILLILGVVAIFSITDNFDHDIIEADILALFGSTFLLVLTMLDGKFTFFEGVLVLLGLLIFLYHTIFSRKVSFWEKFKIKQSVRRSLGLKKKVRDFPVKSLATLFVSSVFIFVGAKYVIDSIVYFSDLANIGKGVIAASVVALGTSLPELAVSWSAARKGNIEVAVGNILGSNIFNAFAVMGIPALFADLKISESILYFGVPMLVASTFMYVFVVQDRRIKKWEGAFLLIFYIFYITKLFV